ncbi:MAG: SufD family Fe-S cluster assembly protein [Sphingomonadaceae bacterium]
MTQLLEIPRGEEWKWSDLSVLPELAEAGPSGELPENLPWLDCEGPRLLFVDGALDRERSDPGPVEVGAVAAKAADHPLARLVGDSGWRLKLAKHHAPPGIVQIVHAGSGGASHLGAEIVLEEDAQASIVETHVGDGWANRLARVALGHGARLMLNRRLLGSSGFVSLTDRAELGEGATLTLVNLAAGDADSRIEGRYALNGDAAYCEVGGALLAGDRRRHEANIVLRHEAPSGMSRQSWRSVAGGRGAASVAARVEVARGAQKTDAEQSLKGLLLDKGATANLKPELEIFADDVKCAHGASVGELDRRALFYLQTRGIPPAEAQALLTRAFVADALERIGEDGVQAAFAQDAEKWLGGGDG